MEESQSLLKGREAAAYGVDYMKREPKTVLRALSLFLSIIIFACICSQGWQYHPDKGKSMCIMNGSSLACSFGSGIAIIAFLAATGMLVAENLMGYNGPFMSMVDLGFSGAFSFFYFVSFCTMANQWASSEEPAAHYGASNVKAAISFTFFSVFLWAGCSFYSWKQFKQRGNDEAQFSVGSEDGGSRHGGYESI